MQNNHQHSASAQQHNKQAVRIRYDMQSQQAQQQYQPRYRSPHPQGGGGNIPRQQHSGVAPQVVQQSQVVQAQQIPQARGGVQHQQLTPPQPQQYAYPLQILQYTPQSQGMATPQYRMATPAYTNAVPTAYYQTPVPGSFNHLQHWQVGQAQLQLQQAAVAQQQYYQQSVPGVQQIMQQPGQQFYVRAHQQPTFVSGPPLQPSTAQTQVPVQTQQPHQTHHVTHQPQSHAVANVGILQVSQVQQQPEQREGAQPPPQRKKKILQICDPNTGRSVFDNDTVIPPSTSDSDAPQPAATSAEDQPVVSINSSEQTLVSSPQISPADDPTKGTEEKSKVRSEFYHKIAQLGDDVPTGRGNAESATQPPCSTTASSTTTEVSTPPSTSPVPSTVLEQEVTIEPESTITEVVQETADTIEETQQEAHVASSSFNGTSDSVHEASLCSISPTPIEKYVTNSPELTASDSAEPSVAPVEIIETDKETTVVLEPFLPERQATPVSEGILPQSDQVDDTSTVSNVNEKDAEFEEDKLIEKTKELILTDESKSTDVETLQNGNMEITDEEPNNTNDEEDDGIEEPMEEGEIDESEDSTTPSSVVKQRVTYNREELLSYKTSIIKESLDMASIPVDLFKDPKTSNSTGGYNAQFKAPAGFPHMASRTGMPMRGPRGDGRMMSMQQGRHMQWGMGQMGQGPLQVPPPFQSPKAPKVLELHTREPVNLHKADSPWKPSPVGRGKGGDEAEKDSEELIEAEVVKKTRGILNKLTPENFEKLVSKFMQLKLEDKDERIGKVIDVVFEKAVDEPNFSTSYARMVKRVCDQSQETAKKFRKKILDKCQKEFQKGSTEEEEISKLENDLEEAEEDKKEALKAELEEKRFMARRRALGNVRFIGELYKLQMLTPKIMVDCVAMLLATQDEENYECLCKLLTTIGQKLEDQLIEAEARAIECRKGGVEPKFSPEHKFMDKTFGKLRNLSENKKLSSRIRFALLDVYELRQNGWKPRRDAAGPKTIDEVRRDAVRQEQEEKRQLQNLTPAPPPFGRVGQSPQPKKGEWNTVAPAKSSRFGAMKKPSGPADNSGLPILGPQGGSLWNRPMNQGPSNKPPPNIPPRMMNNNSNKYAALSSEGRPAPYQPMRHEIVQPIPPPIRTPPTLGNTSRESSRPQTPTRDHTPPQLKEEKDLPLELTDADREVVRNIHEEFMNVRKWDDTLDWIQSRFKGQRIYSFIGELSRMVSDMSKEEQQKTAGSLINTLVKKGLVNKDEVIKTLKDGVITELPDIEVDVPKATSYLAVFLVELFLDQPNLQWLLEFESQFEDFPDTWVNLTSHTLNTLKLRRSEEAVQHLFKQTKGANRFPIQDIPWVAGETFESLSEKMIKVLQEDFSKHSDSFHICTETWDLRNELTTKSLMHALCVVCWKEDEKVWDIPYFEKILVQTEFPNAPGHLPLLWKQALEFIHSKQIDTEHERILWSLMNKLKLIESSNAKDEA